MNALNTTSIPAQAFSGEELLRFQPAAACRTGIVVMAD
jgi:hypothetical protein